MDIKAKKLLKTIYGYDDFREGQKAIVTDILSGKNVLGLLTTGGGKSICYQVPALLSDGLTLIISPLISLMKDQVDTLKYLGVRAGFFYSNMDSNEFKKIIYGVKSKNIKLLYVSPERLKSQSFINFMKTIKISMIAVAQFLLNAIQLCFALKHTRAEMDLY